TGLSDRVSPNDLPSLEQRMGDLRAVMASAGSDSATLVGSSEGGPLSILFSATYPECVDRLICYGSYARRADGVGGSSQPLIERIQSDWGTGKVTSARRGSHKVDRVEFEQAARFERLSATPAAAAAVVAMADQIDVTSILGAVTVPTLVLHRRGDPAIAVAAGRALAAAIGGALMVELEGDDHDPAGGDSEAVLAEIERFVTGTVSPPQLERVLTTVLFTDLVESTSTAAAVGDEQWRDVLDRHDQVCRAEVTQHGGRFVKQTGDGMLARFDGPAAAVRCAHAVSTALEPTGVKVRAGVHTGEVELRGDDIGGIGVHIAARIAAIADPGEVLTSRTVKDLTAGSDLSFEPRGTHELKGIPDRWELHAAATSAI
ncbi:MAG: adenylate/guanylate cyclase domain-containing protein, partial [Acidimicrobiia bacterium]